MDGCFQLRELRTGSRRAIISVKAIFDSSFFPLAMFAKCNKDSFQEVEFCREWDLCVTCEHATLQTSDV